MKKKLLDIPPAYINGKAYIPLRFVFESLGYNVNWDENLSTVNINAATISIKTILPQDAKEKIASGTFLIDVRTAEEYGVKHIKNSTNIPLNELKDRILEVSKKYESRNHRILCQWKTKS